MSQAEPTAHREWLGRLIGQEAAHTIEEGYTGLLTYRGVFGWLFGAGTLICVFLSAINLQWTPGQAFVFPTRAFSWAGLGLLLALLTFWLLVLNPGPAIATVATKATPAQAKRIRWLIVLIIAILQWALGGINSSVIDGTTPMPGDLQLVLLGADILALGWAFGAFSLRAIWQAARSTPVWLRKIPLSTWLLLAITAMGLGLRLWQLDTAIRFPIDNGPDYVPGLFSNPYAPIFGPLRFSGNNFAILWPYLGQITTVLFGPGTSGLLGFRMLDVILSMLSIPALYWLGRQLADDIPTGLVAAALIAVLPPYLQASRIALPNLADALFGTLFIGCLVNALRRNSQSTYFWAGVSLAFCNYFYEGGRLVFDLIALITLAVLLLSGRLWRHRRGVIVFLIGFGLIVMPYLMGMTSDPSIAFSPRLNEQIAGSNVLKAIVPTVPITDLISKFWNDALQYAVLHVIYTPGSELFYETSYGALLLWYVIPFFLLGLYMIIWRQRIGRWLILAWLIIPIVGNAFLMQVDLTARYVLAFPALALIAAIGVRTAALLIGRLLIPLRPIWRVRTIVAITALVTGVLCVAQASYFFTEFVPTYNKTVYRNPDAYDALMRARDYSPVMMVYITGQDLFAPVLDQAVGYIPLSFNYQAYKPQDFTQSIIDSLPKDKRIVFAIDPGDTATLDLLKQHFKLDGPFMSPYDIPTTAQFPLYVTQ